MTVYALNKKARLEYMILELFEAGIKLSGQEVKSVRDGQMRLVGAYVTIARGVPTLVGAHIPRYPMAGPLPDYDPDRSRTLLLHKREIMKLVGKLQQKGLTLVPISVYPKGSQIKVEFALARGKKEFEKRETLKKRDLDRDIRRNFGEGL